MLFEFLKMPDLQQKSANRQIFFDGSVRLTTRNFILIGRGINEHEMNPI